MKFEDLVEKLKAESLIADQSSGCKVVPDDLLSLVGGGLMAEKWGQVWPEQV